MERSELEKSKIDNLEKIRARGLDPYPRRAKVTHTTEELKENFDELSKDEVEVWAAGRIMSVRQHGKSQFMNIRDSAGDIQLYFKYDVVGADEYELLSYLDIGDFINVYGKIFKTRTDEKTIVVEEYALLSKSIRPLPEKWHGLQDVELRIRQRYLDLLINEHVKEIFVKRSKIIQGIRDYLIDNGYLEVTTPVLQSLYGGAFARPFMTHHNALDIDLYLRIADELYLKRLIVGGLDRVFEIGKNFRNEGIDSQHNPEFTSIELYEAYADYYRMMEIAEKLFSQLAQEITGSERIEYRGQELDLSPPFERVKFRDLIEDKAGLDISTASEEELRKFCEKREMDIKKKSTYWNLVDKIFEECVERDLIQPTFVVDYPIAISPLAKRTEDAPDFVERFELFVAGMEMANAFTELNDPFDQRERFEEQQGLRAKGDEEAQQMDEDFIESLEYAMPPTGGMGIGIDRLVMLLTDSVSIREVILFPLTKPKST